MRKFRLPILTYHNISDTIDYYIAVRLKDFQSQFETIAKHYSYIDLDSAFKFFKKKQILKNKFSIAFDDGYTDAIKALDFLSKKSAQATLFIPTNYIGKDNIWNHKATYISSVLDNKQIRQLSKEGHLIASHSKTHQCLTKLSDKEIITELLESKKTLEQIINKDVNFFAYPFGYHDSRTRKLTAKYYKAAFATNKTAKSIDWDDEFQLHRFSVNKNTTLNEIIKFIEQTYD